MNKLLTAKRAAVVRALVEGVSVNATVRMTGVSKPTILKLLRDLGEACKAYHDKHVRGLRPERVQADEIWSFNYCKQGNIQTAKAAPPEAGDAWLWTALDSDSKLIIAYRVGQRTQDDADLFMLDLAGRILGRIQLTSDSLKVYLPAVENAFGLAEVDYAQLHKVFGPEKAGRGAERKYSPAKVQGIKKVALIGMPRREHVSTSHVERHNLTIRMQMRLLSGSRTPTARKSRITLARLPCSSCSTTTAARIRRSARARPSRRGSRIMFGRSKNCWGYSIETLPVPPIRQRTTGVRRRHRLRRKICPNR